MTKKFKERKKKIEKVAEIFINTKLILDYTKTLESELIEDQIEKIELPKLIKFTESFIKSEVSLETPLIIEEQGTGSRNFLKQIKIIEYPFERYIVKVGVTPENEFLGIIEVKVNKDFRSIENRLRNVKVHNLKDFNFEEL